MKRQISICIILAVIVIVLSLIYIRVSNDSKQDAVPKHTENEPLTTDNSQSNFITSSNPYETYCFYAKNDEGRVIVYDVKSQTLYMETGIETGLLPMEMQKELESGIYFKTEEELFDFLESYSS